MQNNILDKINKGELKMTPKKYFALKWTTLFVTSLFFLGLAFYIFAYVTFLFVDGGLIYIPLLTYEGLANFIIEIPWSLVLLGLFSLFLFSITSKTFYKIYRKPFITFFFTILIIIMISHIIFVESGAMRKLKEEAYLRHFQLVPDKFLQFRESQTGTLVVGRIIGTTTDSIIISDRKQNNLQIFVIDAIQTNDFSAGSIINAYIERVDGKLYAKSIEIIE